jgi:hypothetical protein
MAIAEQQPEIPPDQQTAEIPTVPEIPPAVERAGVKSLASTPQPVQGDQNQPTAHAVPAPTGPSVTIPAQSQVSLTQMAKGSAGDSQTWFGVFWLRKIKKAIKDGLAVLFGS